MPSPAPSGSARLGVAPEYSRPPSGGHVGHRCGRSGRRGGGRGSRGVER